MLQDLQGDILYSFYVFEERAQPLLREMPENVRNALTEEYALFRASILAKLELEARESQAGPRGAP